MSAHLLIWIISIVSVAGVIIRPFKTPEAAWAITGAGLLVATGSLLPSEAWKGVAGGLDVYLFLSGMMLLAELARQEKLFDWLAAYATRKAQGSSIKLFILVYMVGTVVTALLSNDATAVVLTPAVIAAMKAAKMDKPLPYLFICVFIANAASFLLPISNPANLVVYGAHMPSLMMWLSAFFIPSMVSIVATFLLLWWSQRKSIMQKIEVNVIVPVLSAGGRLAGLGIILTAVVLLVSSAFDLPLGLPAAASGLATMLIILSVTRRSAGVIVKGISWSVLLLVAGLFVIVEALRKAGLTQTLSTVLQHAATASVIKTTWLSGLIAGFGSNITNNLPSGLIAGQVIQSSPVPDIIRRSVLIGIDLGPNLSVTGSLATILWLVALRREGIQISAWMFLRTGILVMTVALLVTIASLWI